MGAREIAAELEQMVTATPDARRHRGLGWVKRGLRKITTQRYAEAIEHNESLIPLFSNHFKLEHPLVRPLASLALRLYWADLDPFLTDVSKILDVIASTPEKQALFQTPQARRWINKAVQQMYDWLYDYTWGCDSCG